MRILVNVDQLGPKHGVALASLQVTRELARRGHQIDIVYLEGGPFEPAYREFANRLVQIPALSFHLQRPWGAAELIPSMLVEARRRPDVVYDNLLWSLPWSVGAATLARAGLLAHMHGFDARGPGMQQRVLMRHAVKRFVAVSRYSHGQLVGQGVDAERITVVHNGVDPIDYPEGGVIEQAAARRALGLRDDSFVIVFIGRIDPTKGIETLLEAVRRCRTPSEIDILVMGPPSSFEYLDRVKQAGVGLSCFWRSAEPEVVPVLHAADMVAVPSLWEEPFARVPLEAMATGRPVAATRSGGLPEQFTGDFERFLFERGDSAALAALIDGLRNWRRDEPELAERCVEHVRRNFTLTQMVDGVEEALARLARRPRAGRGVSA